MSKEEFVTKMIHMQYVNKLNKRMIDKEIDSYTRESKSNKFTHKFKHARRKWNGSL